ncbi:MAG: aromatic-ring-hydroxylating dioxygenase subunit beta [Candidatus Binatia bacterium]|nr:aromatic-ring-hydroxylating dioxygenase subunit beta [Candidatus Binatia bacterium]
MPEPAVTPELQFQVEQFYYCEARLLDGRQYRTWLSSCSEEVRYVMPARGNPQVDNTMRGQEEMISIDRELEGVESGGAPYREESYLHLSMRVDRAFKPNSWSENPPARTRRIIGNVEIVEVSESRLSALSNFHLYYARPSSESFLYSGQRRDVLLREGDGFKLASREIVMDLANIEYPTLGLFF